MSTTERTWRDEAMDECLRGFHNNEGMDGLIYGIHHADSGLAVAGVWANKEQVLKFLNTQCQEMKSLLQGHFDSLWEGSRVPYIGWFGASWQGEAIEIVFTPGHGNEELLCIASTSESANALSSSIGEFAEKPDVRSLRYASGWVNAPELDKEIGKITWDDIVLKAELLKSVRESVETFFAQKETIQSFGFAWKRGILLVGPPGTGKTMICKAAAAALPDLPFLYVRDLRERNQKESIESIFKRARKLAPCILAMEDLDSLINDSNRSIFLNEMDGFASNEGLLIIASSNHPGKIDEALLRRPSRFDRVFHIGLPEIAERRAFCERLLTRETLAQKLSPDFDVAKLYDDVAQKTDGFTPAYLKEAFLSAALSRAQNGATILDDEFAKAVLEQVTELKAHLKTTKNPDAMAEMRSGDDTIGFRR